MRLKQATIAKELGLTEARVSQMKKRGMPTDSLAAAREWYVREVDQKHSPKLVPGMAMPAGAAAAVLPELMAEAYDIQRARAKRETHEAGLAELRERQALGELVEADRVRRTVTTLAAAARSQLERIPDKLAERLAACADAHACHALLTAEIDQVLTDLAAGADSMQLVAEDGRP